MTTKSFPRVLVVSASPLDRSSNTGITLGSLFEGWPLDRLAQIYGRGAEADTSLCKRNWQLGWDDVSVIGRAIQRIVGPNSPNGGKKLTLGGASNASDYYKPSLRGTIIAWADLFPYRGNERLAAWVDDYRPDVIFSTLGSIRWMELSVRLAKSAKCPLVPFFCDDWPSTHYRNACYGFLPRAAILLQLNRVFRIAPFGTAISTAMTREYAVRFGLRFETFMNCVDVPTTRPVALDTGKGEPIRMVYVGGLHLNRWRSLNDIGDALQTLRARGIDVQATIYAPQRDIEAYSASLNISPAMSIGGSLSAEETDACLRTSDVVIHVESFDSSARSYTRLSVSTKIPQYMAAARPILAYGPIEGASIRYVSDSKCGIAIGTQDQTALTSALAELCSDEGIRQRLALRGWQTALANHDGSHVRERLVRTLSGASPIVREKHDASPGRVTPLDLQQ